VRIDWKKWTLPYIILSLSALRDDTKLINEKYGGKEH